MGRVGQGERDLDGRGRAAGIELDDGAGREVVEALFDVVVVVGVVVIVHFAVVVINHRVGPTGRLNEQRRRLRRDEGADEGVLVLGEGRPEGVQGRRGQLRPPERRNEMGEREADVDDGISGEGEDGLVDGLERVGGRPDRVGRQRAQGGDEPGLASDL